jgi:hypothetical protein
MRRLSLRQQGVNRHDLNLRKFSGFCDVREFLRLAQISDGGINHKNA